MKKFLLAFVLLFPITCNANLVDLALTFQITDVFPSSTDYPPSNPVVGDIYTVYLQYDSTVVPVNPGTIDHSYFGAITEINISSLGSAPSFAPNQNQSFIGMINDAQDVFRDAMLIRLFDLGTDLTINNQYSLSNFSLSVNDYTASAISPNYLASDMNFDLFSEGIVLFNYLPLPGSGLPAAAYTASFQSIAVVPLPPALFLFLSSLLILVRRKCG